MKKGKTSSTLYFVASALFYIAAVISLFTSSETSVTVVWLCLGSSFLCFGAVQKNKQDKNDKE